MWPFKSTSKVAGAVTVTREQLAEVMWNLCQEGAHDFSKQLQHEFQETEFTIEGDQKTILFSECIMLHLWLTSKVLAPEKELLDSVHEHFFQTLQARVSNPKTLENIKAKLLDRYGRYYGAWSNEAKGSQFIFGTEVLQCLVNRGHPNQNLLSHCTEVVMYVLTFMAIVAKTRPKYEIAD
jgi:hypothetical protein